MSASLMASLLGNQMLWIGSLLGLALYGIAIVVHRLYLHPLAKFPGPKLAAITDYWELYEDYFKGESGRLFIELNNLHDRYGPIVRIRPNEIHVKDSDWMEVLYPGSSERRDRDPLIGAALGTPLATMGTGPHEVHRMRRASIHPFFAPRNLASWEPVLQGHADTLRENMHGHVGQILDFRVYFFAWTTDFLTGQIFQKRVGLFWNEKTAENWFAIMFDFSGKFPLTKHFPWMITLALELPLIAWKIMFPSLVPYIAVYHDLLRMTTDAYNRHLETHTTTEKAEEPVDKNIFETILTSDLPPEDKRPKRLANEVFHLLVAGSFSTAKTAAVVAFHILSNPHVHQKLRQELKTAIPDASIMPPARELQQLQYMTAVIKETMRIACIVTTRFPMISPLAAMKHGDSVIPPGASVSMTYCNAAVDPTIFAEPHVFRPERWLSGEQKPHDYDRYVLPFGRGSRACIGMQLAQTQLYLLLCTLFRSFDLELFETTFEQDVKIRGGGPLGEPYRTTKGVRVFVRGTLA